MYVFPYKWGWKYYTMESVGLRSASIAPHGPDVCKKKRERKNKFFIQPIKKYVLSARIL